MDDILDHDETQDSINDNLTSNIKLKTITYFLVVFFGSLVYIKLLFRIKETFFNYIFGVLQVILIYLAIGAAIVGVRFLFRKIKNNKKKVTLKYDPIWFQIVEVGFVWWVFFTGISIIGRYI